jgi:hypothetical protein
MVAVRTRSVPNAQSESAVTICYERDEFGAAFAYELVTGVAFEAALAAAPPAEVADVRVVIVPHAIAAQELPPDIALLHLRPGEPVDRDEVRCIAETLWRQSERYRPPASELTDFVTSGAVALAFPDPPAVRIEHRLQALAKFAHDKPEPLRTAARLESLALERWLVLAFGTPQSFAERILFERLRADGAYDVYAELAFLHEATVSGGSAEEQVLAADRLVVLDQASPWRCYTGEDFAGALRSCRAWRRRYQLAYERHFQAVRREAVRIERRLRDLQCAADELKALAALEGELAARDREVLRRFDAALSYVRSIPGTPDPGRPMTAGIALGAEPVELAGARSVPAALIDALSAHRELLLLAAQRVEALRARLVRNDAV